MFGGKVQEVGDGSSSSTSTVVVTRLKDRVRLLETQLAAYKSDAARTEQERARLQDALSKAGRKGRGGGESKSSSSSAGGESGGGSHAEWAAQKRLLQRADTLARRLREKTEELDVARKQVENAKNSLERVTKEKSELSTRLTNVSRRSGGNGGSGGSGGSGSGRGEGDHLSSALSSLQTAEEARKRAYELEQKCAAMERIIEVEKEGELRSLRAEKDTLADRYEDMERQLKSARRRIKTLEQGMSGGGGGGGRGGSSKTSSDDGGGALYLRSSEDRFREQEEVRGELDQITAERNLLEGRLLERDNLIMELRFDVEAATTGGPLLERRVRELETSNRALASQLVQMDRRGGGGGRNGGSPSSQLSSSQKRKAGERFKRERDLEGVIESQNRVIMKIQSENERLTKRGVSASKIIEAQKELRELRRRTKELESERQDLLDRAASAASAKLDNGRSKDLIRQLKRKVTTTEKKTNEHRRNAEVAMDEKRRLETELAQANTQLTKAERDVERLMTRGSSSSSSSSSSSTATARAEEELRRVATENDNLSTELTLVKSRLVDAENNLRTARSRSSSSSTSSGGGGGGGKREQELEEENAKLRAELESFDLEFFEEVEDLKFKYSQAREENRKLREQLK